MSEDTDSVGKTKGVGSMIAQEDGSNGSAPGVAGDRGHSLVGGGDECTGRQYEKTTNCHSNK